MQGIVGQLPLAQGAQRVIATPASSDTTFPDQNVLDLSIGRVFGSGTAKFHLDVQVFNVFNNDAHDVWETLVVLPGDSYSPKAHVLPRRVMLRAGIKW